MTESFEISNLGLDGLNCGIDLVELFKFEQTVADWALVKNHENHCLIVECELI